MPILTDEQKRMIRDYSPTLGNRGSGIDLADLLDTIYDAAVSAGADTIGDTPGYYTTDTVDAAFDALGIQIGGDDDATFGFSEQNFVTDDDALYAALDKLDVQAGAQQAATGLANAHATNTAMTNPAVADGTTDGKVQNANSVDYKVGGGLFTKAGTDDLWDLTGETDTAGGQYRAYSLELDDSGTATFQASGNEASAGDALAGLPNPSESRIAVFIADPACDFDGAALSGQGNYYNGWPDSV